MKNILLTTAIALLCCSSLAQQSQTDRAIENIERNNTRLKAAMLSSEAESLRAMSGIFMENPEFEFSYLWGAESGRVDVAVSQSLDFPSVYVQKRKIGKLGQELSEIGYRAVRREVLLEARTLCVELTYLNAMLGELSGRHKKAQTLVDGYASLVAKGSASLLEANKAKMSLLSIETQLSEAQSNRQASIERLTALNGGVAIDFTQATFETTGNLGETGSFDEWFDKVATTNPAMQYLSSQIKIQERQVKLSVAEGLPKLAVGYKSEAPMMAHEQFQGVIVGVSIPLWQNTNSVKAAKAELRATQSSAADQKLQFYQNLRALYNRTVALERISASFKSSYLAISISDLLRGALAAGEISLLEYITELGLNYSLIDQGLATERELNLARVELFSF